jgi:hypothetical protein
VQADVTGRGVSEVECVMLTYDVSNEPETRREISQLQRWLGSGNADVGTLKVCVTAPQEQDTVRSLVVMVVSRVVRCEVVVRRCLPRICV